jgi:hypothetical protein
MLQQLSPRTVITKFERIAEASEQLITTDLPASQLGTFAELALKARSQPVGTVSFVPPAINTSAPDIDKIRLMIDRAIDRSSGKAVAKPKAARHGFSTQQAADGASVGGSLGNLREGYAANKATDLSAAC